MTLKDITGETPMSALLKETTPTTAQVVTSSMQAEPPAVDDADLISPDDFNARRTQYYRQVRQAVEEAFPIKNERYTLHVRDVRWDKEDTPSIEEQRKATLEGHNLTRKLSGKYELIDNATGQPVQTTNRRTLLNMPVLSQDGTYIVNGNAYTCLHPSTKIWTEDGEVPIYELYMRNKGIRVWSYDFNAHAFVLKPVLNFTKHKIDRDIGSIPTSIEFKRVFNTFHGTQRLWVTPTHKLMQMDGREIPAADASTMLQVNVGLNADQIQFVKGCLLGDASISMGILRTVQCDAQKEYVELKRRVLGKLAKKMNRRERKDGIRWGVDTHANRDFHALQRQCYTGGVARLKKQIHAEFLQGADERCLSFWFFDDGSCRWAPYEGNPTNSPVVHFHTNGFDWESIRVILSWLHTRWGIDAKPEKGRKYKNKPYGWVLRLNAEDSWKVLSLVAPYAPECMRYKFLPRPGDSACKQCLKPITRGQEWCDACLLSNFKAYPQRYSKQVRHRFGTEKKALQAYHNRQFQDDHAVLSKWEKLQDRIGVSLKDIDTELVPTISVCDVTFEENTGKRWEKTRTVYNMEVADTHNYVANGIIVSNCAMQMRLMPAVYARVTSDGYPEAQFNIRPRTGQSFRIQMEPKTSVFYITSGGRKIPFYPVMKAMGVDDKALEISWGPEILKANQAQKVNPHALQWIQEAARRGLPKEIPK